MSSGEANTVPTVERIIEALGERALELVRKSERRVYIDIAPDAVVEASRLMFEEVGARLQIATGVDTPAGIEVMYHWALDREDCVVTLRVTVDHEAPALDSIAVMCPAAEWIEREIWELLGVEFRGHPDMRHLLLDDSWPEGNFPLRRGYRGHGPLQQDSPPPVGAGHAREESSAARRPPTVGAGHAREESSAARRPPTVGAGHAREEGKPDA
jgi:Ni,Fe-hydrogenase III component G